MTDKEISKHYPIRLGKPTKGANILITHDEHILLVRNWVGFGHWSLPGGGIDDGEDPKSAALREVFEELRLSVEIHDELGYIENTNNFGRPGNHVYLAKATKRQIRVDHMELRDAKWFHPDFLPEHQSPLLLNVLSHPRLPRK